ncbi:MAG: PAS domain S-box protein [Pseudomonadota bacterium]
MTVDAEKNEVRIIVVHNQAVDQDGLEAGLEALGYFVQGRANSAREAADLPARGGADLVLLDTTGPGEAWGLGVARAIREKWDLPIVFIIKDQDAASLEWAQPFWPHGLLLKPFRGPDLKIAVETALGAAEFAGRVRAAEERTRRREEKYRLLTENAPLGLQSLDEAGCILEVNDRWLAMLGYGREEVVGRRFGEFLAPGRAEGFAREFAEKIRSRALTNNIQLKLRRRDGTYLAADYTSRLVWDDRGRFPRAHCVFQDVSGRNQVEAELVGSRERLRRAQGIGRIGDWDYEVRTGAVTWSDMTYELFGRDKSLGPPTLEEALGLHPPEEAARFRERLGLALGQGESYGLDLTTTLANGERRRLFALGEPIRDETGRVARIAGTFQDVTTQRQNEEALRESEELFRAISEYSRNPICIVDQNGRITWLNDRMLEVSGYSRRRLLEADSFLEFLAPESVEFVMGNYLKFLAGEPYLHHYRFAFIRADGEKRVLEKSMTGYSDRQGNKNLIINMVDITDRLRSEQALQESEKKFRRLLETASEGVWAMDAEHRTTFVNEVMAEMLGRAAEEMIGRKVEDFMLPQDIAEHEAQMRVRHAGRSGRYERRFRRKDGSEVWTIVSAAALADEDGNYNGSFAMLTDITERKRAEENIRLKDELLRLTGEMSQVGGWEFDPVTQKGTWTEEVARIHDLDPSRETSFALGVGCYAGESREKIERAIKRAVELAEPYDLILEMTSALGRVKWVRTMGLPIVQGGQVVKVRGIFQDITEQKKSEEALRDSERLFRTLVEGAPDAIFVQINKKFAYLNQAALSLFGLESAEQLLDHPVVDRFHPSHRDQVRERIRSLNEKKESAPRLEEAILRLDGTEVLVEVSAVPVNLKGEDGAVVFIRDVTERKKMENQLRQAQKMEAVGALAGGVAHDFNNLLQAINGYAEVLLLDKQASDSDYPGLKAIREAGSRAAGLVKKLLLFSRKAESERRFLEPRQVVDQARGLLERTIPKMVKIEVQAKGRIWNIKADPVQMEQIILNLGTNAADAMPDGGRLLVELENITLTDDFVEKHMGAAPGRYVLLSVSDTGTGMDRETREHIFEPFFTTKEIGKGTGLGLASVFGIVKGHDGYISCYSEVGQGSVFKIYLPALGPNDEGGASIREAAPPRGGAETILVVDDEGPIRDFAGLVLKRFGYTALTASTGEEALEVYFGGPARLDLVIMDIGMPGMGGRQCLAEILRRDPAARVIVASGYSVDGQVKQALEAGAAGYVGKPYQLSDLLRKVREVLDQGR